MSAAAVAASSTAKPHDEETSTSAETAVNASHSAVSRSVSCLFACCFPCCCNHHRHSSCNKMVHKVQDQDDFKSQLTAAGSKLVVVDFFATWCGPCKLIAPVLEKISTTDDKVVILKVDVDENEELTAEYNVSSMPTFIFFKNGQKIESFSGASESKLREMIEKHK
nr:Tyr p 40 allergen [Tyrophagus putrescentiae]